MASILGCCCPLPLVILRFFCFVKAQRVVTFYLFLDGAKVNKRVAVSVDMGEVVTWWGVLNGKRPANGPFRFE